MARVTVTFSISVPPEMAAELESIRKREHRTRSELLREALRVYVSTRVRYDTAPASNSTLSSEVDHSAYD